MARDIGTLFSFAIFFLHALDKLLLHYLLMGDTVTDYCFFVKVPLTVIVNCRHHPSAFKVGYRISAMKAEFWRSRAGFLLQWTLFEHLLESLHTKPGGLRWRTSAGRCSADPHLFHAMMGYVSWTRWLTNISFAMQWIHFVVDAATGEFKFRIAKLQVNNVRRARLHETDAW